MTVEVQAEAPALSISSPDPIDRKGPALSATSDVPVLEVVEPTAEEAAAAKAAADKADADKAAADKAEADKIAAAETPDKPKEPRGVAKKLDEQDKRIAEEKRRADGLQEQLATALKSIETLTGKDAAQVVKKVEAADPRPVRPRRAAFEQEDQYEAALDTHDTAMEKWTERTAERVAEARAAAVLAKVSEDNAKAADTSAADAEQGKVVSTFNEREAKFIETTPDYAEFAKNEDVKITWPMAQAIMEAENGPEVAYYLGKNPDEAERIAAMIVPGMVFPKGHPLEGQPAWDFRRQTVAMTRLITKLEAARPAQAAAPEVKAEVKAEPEKPPPVSKAPDPVKPTGARANAAPAAPKSGDEYFARRTVEKYGEKRLARLN